MRTKLANVHIVGPWLISFWHFLASLPQDWVDGQILWGNLILGQWQVVGPSLGQLRRKDSNWGCVRLFLSACICSKEPQILQANIVTLIIQDQHSSCIRKTKWTSFQETDMLCESKQSIKIDTPTHIYIHTHTNKKRVENDLVSFFASIIISVNVNIIYVPRRQETPRKASCLGASCNTIDRINPTATCSY